MKKGMEQELEWKESQKIKVNVDLIAEAKQQLEFLASVDRNRWLYHGTALHTAIYRYNSCWIPMLAKHLEFPFFEGKLVVPLDCDWIWHCHRLNPVQYKSDCEEMYGKILDSRITVSSIQGTSEKETEEVWKKLYPNEPYQSDPTSVLSDNNVEKIVADGKFTKYDLISAVERQSPFFYQVSRTHMSNDLYLEGAVARYKAFLYLIKRNQERSIRSFSVPTYDIDLIWHTHQLHPVSYCDDLVRLMGKVLEHDDTDSDRTEGQKLDVGFSGTIRNYERLYGCRYWRAGAMYQGATPPPIRTTPYCFNSEKKVIGLDQDTNIMRLPESKMIEVVLEFVRVKDVINEHKGSLYVTFSKTTPDAIFSDKRKLSILSESGEKQVACFHCQPSGNMLFELISHSPFITQSLGSCTISLEDLISEPGLMVEKWLEMIPFTNNTSTKPISLRVAISVTPPTPAPFVLHMIRGRSSLEDSCNLPLSDSFQYSRNWTRIIDEDGNAVITLQMRETKNSEVEKELILRREVVGVLKSGEIRTLAECVGTEWSFRCSPWSIQVQKSTDIDGHILELTGHHTLRFYPGRKLEYETQQCQKQINEQDFVTAVEFSEQSPYGRAVALLNLNSGIVMAKENWIFLPCSVIAFVLGENMRTEGYLVANAKNLKERFLIQQGEEKKLELHKRVTKGKASIPIMAGGCGGCGGGC
ncbi:hypothetical protein Leryth_015467 [Lithospermum erythrorhizon]|nr:hypothetical protein Leryth_015467 [Lithospermum erythrorhizon]